MGMLKSRADELARRLSQVREALRTIEKSLEHFESDVRLLASDTEKIEAENIRLNKQIEEMKKEHAKEMAKKVA